MHSYRMFNRQKLIGETKETHKQASRVCLQTAAHCISGDDVVSVNVEFGRVSKDDTSSEDVDVESFEIHPEFSTTTRLNDIAVLRLVKAVSIPPANVPFDKEEEDLVPNTGQDVTVVGFGATTGGGLGSDKLLEISINVQNTGNCDVFKFGMDNDSQFCAGGDGKVRKSEREERKALTS